MANPTVTVAAADPVMTAKEVRAQFKYLETAEDPLLEAYIAAATEYLETWLRRAFVSRTYQYSLDGFFDRDRSVNPFERGSEIVLPRPPVTSVTSIKYDDVAGDEQTVDAGDYVTDLVSEPARVKPSPTAAWPATQTGAYNTVRITYVAGYATAAAVPENFKMLIRWIVANWWRNREPVAPTDLREVPHTVVEFISQFKIWRVG